MDANTLLKIELSLRKQGVATLLATDFLVCPESAGVRTRERVSDSMRQIMKWFRIMPADEATALGNILADAVMQQEQPKQERAN